MGGAREPVLPLRRWPSSRPYPPPHRGAGGSERQEAGTLPPSTRIESLPGPGFDSPGDFSVAFPPGRAFAVAGSELTRPSGVPSPIPSELCPWFGRDTGHGPVRHRRHVEERPAPGREEHDLLIEVDANPHSALVNRPVVAAT